MTQTKDYYMPKPLAYRLNTSEEKKLIKVIKSEQALINRLTTYVKYLYGTVTTWRSYVDMVVDTLNYKDRLLNSLRNNQNNSDNPYHNVKQEDYLVAFKATYKEYISMCEQYGFKINLNIIGLSRLRKELHVLKEHGVTQLVCKYRGVKQQDVIITTTPTLRAIIDTLIDYGFVCKHVNTVEHIIKAMPLNNCHIYTEYAVSTEKPLIKLLGEETSLLYVASGKNYCYVLVDNKNNTIVVNPDEYKANGYFEFKANVCKALIDSVNFKVIHKPF